MDDGQGQRDVAAAARRVVATHGLGVLSVGGKRFVALLTDYAPFARREIRVLGQALDAGAYASLYSCPGDRVDFERARLVGRLEADLGLRQDLAIWSINLVAELAKGVAPQTMPVTSPPSVALIVEQPVVPPIVATGPVIAEIINATTPTTPAGPSLGWRGIVLIVVCTLLSPLIALFWYAAFPWRVQTSSAFLFYHLTVGLIYFAPLLAAICLRRPWVALVISLISGALEMTVTSDGSLFPLHLASGLVMMMVLLLRGSAPYGRLTAVAATMAAVGVEFVILWLVMSYFYYSGLSSVQVLIAGVLRIVSAGLVGAVLIYPTAFMLRGLFHPRPQLQPQLKVA